MALKERKLLSMEHKHIPPKHPDWGRYNYQCVCGFKTCDRFAFDKHLRDNSHNTALKSDAEKLCKICGQDQEVDHSGCINIAMHRLT